MFWWGDYSVSTEHMVYLNLKNGIPAPRSDSAEMNGLTIAEKIDGQIFIDTWGLIFPGDPANAAEDATIMASVSHDKNGLYGAAFISACIAQTFVTNDIDELIDIGLSFIPSDSTYAAVVMAVSKFHAQILIFGAAVLNTCSRTGAMIAMVGIATSFPTPESV